MADYYEILGLNKNASSQEIKQAFRRLAQQYHPDKAGGNAEKFREVNEAYQTLSDPEKKKMYDQYGSAFEQAQSKGGFSGFDNFRDWASWAEAMKGSEKRSDFGDFGFGNLGDIFENIFSAGGGSDFGGDFSRSSKLQGHDIEIELAVDFQEAVFGTEKEIKLERYDKCKECGGSGLEQESKFVTCRRCQGRGQVYQSRSTFFGTFQTTSICPDCKGKGKVPEKKCKRCRGQGRIKDISKIKLKIPAGIDQGQTIKFAGQGEAGESGVRPGDLYVTVLVRSDSKFKRRGNDILSQSEISISQAVLGDKIEIETIDGPVKLKIPSGTSSGQEFRLKGKGVVGLSGNKSKDRGDHLVKIKVKIPKNLNRKQKKLLEDLKQEGL